MLHPSTLTFLKALKKNNNKEWFDRNREKYEAARNDFNQLVSEVLKKMSVTDPDMKGLTVKGVTFRIYRDTRFSKNKSPYKTNMGAAFNKGGKKSFTAGYYFHAEPGGQSFAGGGLWIPDPALLKKVRQEIDYCFPEFKKILAAPSFKKTYHALEEDEKQMLARVPKGYEKDNPAAAYLRMKSIIASTPIPDTMLTSPSLVKEITAAFKALMPLINFLNRAME